MPAIVPRDRWAAWLDPDNHDTDALSQVLEPRDVDGLTMHEVSMDVNNVRNNDASLMEVAAI